MNGTWSQLTLVLFPVVVGAAIGVIPTILVDWSRGRATLRTRWDPALEEVCADFASAVRRILELTETTAGPTEHSVKSVGSEHGHLQRCLVEIRLLAGPEVQVAARQVVRHTWALQTTFVTGVDPRAIDYPTVDPRERTLSSLFAFYLAVRKQLRVPQADRVVPLNPPLDLHFTEISEPLCPTDDERRSHDDPVDEDAH
jgi:hypothetical protein